MKHRFATLAGVVLLATGLLPAQLGQRVQLDTEQARQELEILKGILETTLRFSDDEPWTGQIESFYLYRQGAVFVVPLGFRGRLGADLLGLRGVLNQTGRGLAYNEDLLASLGRRLQGLDRALALASELPAPPPPPHPPEPDSPPEPPTAPEPPSAAIAGGSGTAPEPGVGYVAPDNREARLAYEQALEERLRAFEENFEERKADIEERERESQQRLMVLETKLVEALAKYADALTIVGSDEYITLILSGSHFPLQLQGVRGARARVLTVSKQSVIDYNTGKLSLEAFKQQVLAYEL